MYVSDNWPMYFVNAFAGNCYRYGQRQQQQHFNDVARVTMPATGHKLLSTRRPHAMHAAYHPFGSN